MKRGVQTFFEVPSGLAVCSWCTAEGCKATGVVRRIDTQAGTWECEHINGSRHSHTLPKRYIVNRAHYPNNCPRCGQPAYVGATPASLDCSADCY